VTRPFPHPKRARWRREKNLLSAGRHTTKIEGPRGKTDCFATGPANLSSFAVRAQTHRMKREDTGKGEATEQTLSHECPVRGGDGEGYVSCVSPRVGRRGGEEKFVGGERGEISLLVEERRLVFRSASRRWVSKEGMLLEWLKIVMGEEEKGGESLYSIEGKRPLERGGASGNRF